MDTLYSYVPVIELQRLRRNSPNAQSAAEFMARGNHMSVESPVHYADLAELIDKDERNLKRILDKYPGFVRIAGTALYFYLPEFLDLAKAQGSWYPLELPYALKRRTDIPLTVGPAAETEVVQGPTEVVPTKVYGAKDDGTDKEWISVRLTGLSPAIRTNENIVDRLISLSELVCSNMLPGHDGKLPGEPATRFADLNELLGFVATLTRMADK